MSFGWETFAFEFLTLSICAIVIIAHRWTKKVTTTYWWWLGVSILYLAFLIGTTWWKHWYYFFTNIQELLPATTTWFSNIVSYALLTNICYLFAFAMPILLIADPTRRAARALAPICSLASMMVLLIVIPFKFTGAPHFDFQYLILGNYDNCFITEQTTYNAWSLFYSLHLINLLFAIGVWLTTPRYGWKGTIGVGGAYGATYLYVGIIVAITNQIGQAAGLVPWDFTDGNFRMVYDMCGGNLPLAQAVFFTTVVLVMFIWTFLQDFAFKRGWYQFGNKKSGVWWRYWDYEHFTPNSEQKDWGKFAKLLPKVRYNYI